MRLFRVSAVLALGLACSTFAAAADTGASDPNLRTAVERFSADRQARQVFDQLIFRDLAAPGDACALVVLPGPVDGFNIRLTIFNLIRETLAFTEVNTFAALGNASVLIESVFSPAAPAGGTIEVLYPTTTPGKGATILGTTDFGLLETVSFNLDPDSYDDPAFGATVEQMNGTVIQVVYNGARRCSGTLTFDAALGTSMAFLTQTSATP